MEKLEKTTHSPCLEKKNDLKKVKVELQIKGIAPFLAFPHLASVDFHLLFVHTGVQLVAIPMYTTISRKVVRKSVHDNPDLGIVGGFKFTVL